MLAVSCQCCFPYVVPTSWWPVKPLPLPSKHYSSMHQQLLISNTNMLLLLNCRLLAQPPPSQLSRVSAQWSKCRPPVASATLLSCVTLRARWCPLPCQPLWARCRQALRALLCSCLGLRSRCSCLLCQAWLAHPACWDEVVCSNLAGAVQHATATSYW
jgi:hypothetical protein